MVPQTPKCIIHSCACGENHQKSEHYLFPPILFYNILVKKGKQHEKKD